MNGAYYTQNAFYNGGYVIGTYQSPVPQAYPIVLDPSGLWCVNGEHFDDVFLARHAADEPCRQYIVAIERQREMHERRNEEARKEHERPCKLIEKAHIIKCTSKTCYMHEGDRAAASIIKTLNQTPRISPLAIVVQGAQWGWNELGPSGRLILKKCWTLAWHIATIGGAVEFYRMIGPH